MLSKPEFDSANGNPTTQQRPLDSSPNLWFDAFCDEARVGLRPSPGTRVAEGGAPGIGCVHEEPSD